jgi:perosamine synthetase
VNDVIKLAQPTFGDEELEAVRAVLASGWVAGQGPRGRQLEERFAKLCGVEHAVAVSSCTAALHLTLLALGVGSGDEVIVADYTYPATAHAVLFTGAAPVFVDVRRDTWTLDTAACEALVGPRTRGIIAVDAFGQCADYDELGDLASRHGLFLLEDAATTVGAMYRDRPAGSLADSACFSLHARKGITSGEGGVIVTNDATVAEGARKLSSFGVESAYTRRCADEPPVPVFDRLGFNYKLSDLQAAVAIAQLDRLPVLLEARGRVARAYSELLDSVPTVEVPYEADDREHTWQSYVVALEPGIARARIVRGLADLGIESTIGTFACHRQPIYTDPNPCPVSADLFARHLAIPMHANLTDDDIERVAHGLASVVEREAD